MHSALEQRAALEFEPDQPAKTIRAWFGSAALEVTEEYTHQCVHDFICRVGPRLLASILQRPDSGVKNTADALHILKHEPNRLHLATNRSHDLAHALIAVHNNSDHSPIPTFYQHPVEDEFSIAALREEFDVGATFGRPVQIPDDTVLPLLAGICSTNQTILTAIQRGIQAEVANISTQPVPPQSQERWIQDCALLSVTNAVRSLTVLTDPLVLMNRDFTRQVYRKQSKENFSELFNEVYLNYYTGLIQLQGLAELHKKFQGEAKEQKLLAMLTNINHGVAAYQADQNSLEYVIGQQLFDSDGKDPRILINTFHEIYDQFRTLAPQTS